MNHFFHRIVFVLLCMLLWNMQSVTALPYRLMKTDQGLSSSLITYLYQDRYGMMWVATEDGLNRFDGVNITTYHQEAGEHTLVNSFVRSMIEDAEGNLIVSTYDGVQLYRRESDDFSEVACFRSGDVMTRSVTDMVRMADGSIYGTGDVLCRLSVEAGKVVIDTVAWQMPKYGTGELVKGMNETLWIRYNNRLFHVNPTIGVLEELSLPSSSNGSPDMLLGDGFGNVYYSSQGILYQWKAEGLSPLNARPFDNNCSIRSLLRYDETHLQLGTEGKGLLLLDEKQGTLTTCTFDIPTIDLSTIKAHHMLRDREGNVWIGIYQKGLLMISTSQNRFRQIGSKGLLADAPVLSLCQGGKGEVWAATDGAGLYRITADGASIQRIEGNGIPPIINAVYEDSKGGLWLGSYSYPCYRRRPGRTSFERVDGFSRESGLASRVFGIQEDREHRLWFATMGNNVLCYDLEKERFEEVNTAHINPWQNCLLVTSDRHLLVGTYDGIYCLDLEQFQKEAVHVCQRSIVYTLYEDADGRLWAGTSEGLFSFSITNGIEHQYTKEDGLPSNSIYAMHNDAKGRLWLSTNAGLSCFDIHANKFSNYTSADGLQSNEFSKNSVVSTSDGGLWFGGVEGISCFNEISEERSLVSLHPRIINLLIDNRPINALTETDGEQVCDSAVFLSDTFSFSREYSSFSIQLATEELDTPGDLEFHYAIDGGKWNRLPRGSHLITISQLPSGRHQFEYKAVSGEYTSEVSTATIIVRYPWWCSPWAIALYCCIVILIVVLLFGWMRSREKVKLLSLLSHKIRTPMSLIISPLQQLIESDSDPERNATYRMMLRNADRLQHLAAQATEEVPIGPIPMAADDDAPDAENKKSRTTWSVLIVEDDDEVRGYLQRELSADFHVRVAHHGKEALEAVFQKQPDAIISDVTMPEMDGITLCKKLKKNIKLAHIPVVLLTARADEESNLQGLGIGADAYITKPFSIRILRQKVINLILLRQQLKNTYQEQLLQDDKQKDIEAVDYDDLFMQRVMDCINRHLSEQDFSVETLCDEVGISRTQLHRRLKEKTNQSTSIFVRNVRLHQAEKLLRESKMRISEVAELVGFGQSTNFSNAFKELYGLSPKEFREKENNP